MGTITVATDSFLELGRHQARTLGFPDLRLVVIPHPLAGLDRAEAEERGRAVGRELLRLLDRP